MINNPLNQSGSSFDQNNGSAFDFKSAVNTS